MAEKWILASPGKWGKNGPKNGKNGPKFHVRAIFGPFFPFSGPFSPHAPLGEAKIHFPAISIPIFGVGGPKRLCTRSTGLQVNAASQTIAESQSVHSEQRHRLRGDWCRVQQECFPSANLWCCLHIIFNYAAKGGGTGDGQRSDWKLEKVGPAPLQKCVGDFCCINFGGFCRGFSWRIFLGTFAHKNEEKKPATKSAKKSSGPKLKIREKSVLPWTDPKKGTKKRPKTRKRFQKVIQQESEWPTPFAYPFCGVGSCLRTGRTWAMAGGGSYKSSLSSCRISCLEVERR